MKDDIGEWRITWREELIWLESDIEDWWGFMWIEWLEEVVDEDIGGRLWRGVILVKDG